MDIDRQRLARRLEAHARGRRQRGQRLADDGALLVRPDQHVGWRAGGLVADPIGTLRDALAALTHSAS